MKSVFQMHDPMFIRTRLPSPTIQSTVSISKVYFLISSMFLLISHEDGSRPVFELHLRRVNEILSLKETLVSIQCTSLTVATEYVQPVAEASINLSDSAPWIGTPITVYEENAVSLANGLLFTMALLSIAVRRESGGLNDLC